MDSLRRMERNLFPAPEVDINDFETYPIISDGAYDLMESAFCTINDEFYFFPFVSSDNVGKPFISVYIWDVNLKKKEWIRFVICEGMRLSEEDEERLFEYLDKDGPHHRNVFYDPCFIVDFMNDVKKAFPSWNFKPAIPIFRIADVIKPLYYSSHRSGCREILLKSGLAYIAQHLDEMPSYNMNGTTPEEIIGRGVPLRLLKFLNSPALVERLIDEDKTELAKAVYRKYSGYIQGNTIRNTQWYYLETLYANGGTFLGRPFYRKLYNKLGLAGSSDETVLHAYEQYYELIDKLTKLSGDGETWGKRKLPGGDEIRGVVASLETAYNAISESDTAGLGIAIRARESDLDFSYGDFLIRLPKDIIEFCKEAFCQKNCLLEYLSTHAQYGTTIAFVRKISEPYKSFVTVEIFEGEIVQAYARCNDYPAREVYEFLEKFAHKKGLMYEPRDLIYSISFFDEYSEENEDIVAYVEDYERRHGMPEYPCEDTEYPQITLADCFPNLIAADAILCA